MMQYRIPMQEYKREGYFARKKRLRVQGSLIMPKDYTLITCVIGGGLIIAVTVMIIAWLCERV